MKLLGRQLSITSVPVSNHGIAPSHESTSTEAVYYGALPTSCKHLKTRFELKPTEQSKVKLSPIRKAKDGLSMEEHEVPDYVNMASTEA